MFTWAMAFAARSKKVNLNDDYGCGLFILAFVEMVLTFLTIWSIIERFA